MEYKFTLEKFRYFFINYYIFFTFVRTLSLDWFTTCKLNSTYNLLSLFFSFNEKRTNGILSLFIVWNGTSSNYMYNKTFGHLAWFDFRSSIIYLNLHRILRFTPKSYIANSRIHPLTQITFKRFPVPVIINYKSTN